MTSLDRSSFKPIYYQLSESIRAMIHEGLAPGNQIPSENELVAKYSVSRNTVRLAMDVLMKQGLVYRVKGKGTFVAPRPMRYGLLQLVSFTEEMRRRGLRPGSRIINLARVVPPRAVAACLQLQPGQEAFEIERLRLADDEPLALNTSYVPAFLCPTLEGEDLAAGSLYELLEGKYHLRLGRADQVLRPTVAGEYEAAVLQIEFGSPLLLVEGVTYLDDDVPVEYARLLFRGDRYEFTVQALRHSDASERRPGTLDGAGGA